MKRKKAGTLHSELHFSSSLELEQATQIITALANTYPVTLTERNLDCMDFEVKFRHGVVKGKLQRWRGNETRVICTGDVSRVVVNENDLKIVSTPVVFMGGIVFFMLLSAGQAIPALVGIGALGALSFTQQSKFGSNEPEVLVVFRERDAIFQYLIDSFKASGEVEPL